MKPLFWKMNNSEDGGESASAGLDTRGGLISWGVVGVEEEKENRQ